MSTEMIKLPEDVLSSLVLNGDVSKLNPTQKMQYYSELCNRIGVDPATQPFKLLKLQGKEVFYADKGATQQLSQKHNISHEIVKREQVKDVYVVTVRAKLPDGRYTDEDGAVTIASDTGDKLANSLMKATTKAKRRAVLALLGLGMMDESEIETIPNAQKVELKTDVPSIQEAVVVTDETFQSFKKEMNECLGIQHLKDIFTAINVAYKSKQITKQQYDELTALKDKLKETLK